MVWHSERLRFSIAATSWVRSSEWRTLGNWVKAYRARHQARNEALTEAERVELVRLREEVAELGMNRAFLTKDSLFFAQKASDTSVLRSN